MQSPQYSSVIRARWDRHVGSKTRSSAVVFVVVVSMMLVYVFRILSYSLASTALVISRGQSQASVHTPVAYQVTNSPVSTNLTAYDAKVAIRLHSANLATIDYGSEVEGWPFIDVLTVDGPSVIELKFTEAYAGLNNPNGDGPWTFSNGLSNTWRTERYNIDKPGRYTSALLQGGLRWQSIELLSGEYVEIYEVGLTPSLQVKDSDKLPGFFNSSKKVYNDLWSLGAKVVQLSCFDAYSQPSTWGVTGQGVFIQGQQPAQSLKGTGFANYTLKFETLSVKGGTGWKIAASPIGFGSYFVITADDYPTQSISSTNFPTNTLLYGFGYNVINQTSLTSGSVQQFPLHKKFESGIWHNISTTISDNGFAVVVDGIQAALIGFDEAKAYASNSFLPQDVWAGTWGFGPFQDQSAYIKNVEVIAANGSTIYTNSMTSRDILDEFAIDSNSHSVCVDGSKRDRLVWLGDFIHTARTILGTTNRADFITGTLDFAFELQLQGGPGDALVPMDAALGLRRDYVDTLFPIDFLLVDYQIFTLKTIGDYYRLTGDVNGLKLLWPQIKRLAQVLLTKINPSTGLVAGLPTDVYFISGFQQNATSVTALLATTMQGLSVLAEAYNDESTAQLYSQTATNLNTAINQYLWSDTLGSYSISLQDPGNHSLAGTAFAILSGAANKTQATLSILKLSTLLHTIGYKDTSSTPTTNTTQLSPNIQGFLLESLFYAHTNLNVSSSIVVPVITQLLDTFWPHMLQYPPGNNEYYTGTTWEYLYPDGSPGLGLFTSHAHPWGSAPTYVLSEYILGVRPLTPGYKTWTFDPVLGKELGLSFVEGRVPTPFGPIDAKWSICGDDGDGEMVYEVKAAPGMSGVCGGKACP